MKTTNLCIALLLTLAMFSCKKSTPGATYQIDGIQDLTFTNGADTVKALGLTVLQNANTTTQETVTVSFSSLPAGITMNTVTGSLSGTPSFQVALGFYDTSLLGAAPGVYPITVTSKGSISGTKTYKFNITVNPGTAYTASMTGTYTNCNVFVPSPGGPVQNATYTDNVSVDPTYNNKVWFSNFYNTGQRVYGVVSVYFGDTTITVPNQTVGGYTFTENANATLYNGAIQWQSYVAMQVTLNGSTSKCTSDMQR